ncbi:MAG TPA: N-formylglutamate amidohydrolase [Rhizobiaceae bacterium]|nr:N-formylglutamate amidohydrolase [Rhizobiaceae bacterium]
MSAAELSELASDRAVEVTNRGGKSPFLVICDHASNHVPEPFGTLGLEAADLQRHIAWDPGALPVAKRLAEVLDATLVASCISRLVIDCNRPLDAPDLISALSEATAVPGNENLSDLDRRKRIALSWEPFHAAIEDVIEERLAAGRGTWLLSVHSFTPVYHGKDRPWHVGIIHDDDTSLAAPLIEALLADKELVVGKNEPYSPADRVYFTLEQHGRSRNLPCAMIEIRNDEIEDGSSQRQWGDRLAAILKTVPLAERAAGGASVMRAHARGGRQ